MQFFYSSPVSFNFVTVIQDNIFDAEMAALHFILLNGDVQNQ